MNEATTGMNAAPWLSIVTVVKDDLDGLVRTRDSVYQQATEGIEWLVIDGSRDEEASRSAAQASLMPTSYHWTAPHGIYPAMNHGIDQCAGTYAWFVNAGDEVVGTGTLDLLREVLVGPDPLWLIGQVAFVDARGVRTIPPPFDYDRERRRLFAGGRFAPHQGTIARLDWLRNNRFDTRYRIAADYELSLRLSLAAPAVTTSAVIAQFHLGGTSTRQWQAAVHEFHEARRRVFAPTGWSRAQELTLTGADYVRGATGAFLRRARRSA